MDGMMRLYYEADHVRAEVLGPLRPIIVEGETREDACGQLLDAVEWQYKEEYANDEAMTAIALMERPQ